VLPDEAGNLQSIGVVWSSACLPGLACAPRSHGRPRSSPLGPARSSLCLSLNSCTDQEGGGLAALAGEANGTTRENRLQPRTGYASG
jgi:hypothetical protein